MSKSNNNLGTQMKNHSSDYKFAQVFGYKGVDQKIQHEDIISVMKFDKSGDFLALGDHAGRVIIFQKGNSKKMQCQFDYYSEFQSHSKQFDCLKSTDVLQGIVDIKWLRDQGRYQKLLTSNSKTIKMWKIFQAAEKKTIQLAGQRLNIPKLEKVDQSFVSNIQYQFPSKHQTDIKQINPSNNQEYVLSFDQIQGFLWSMQKRQKPYIVKDLKGNSEIEDVKENITCGKFHPNSDNLFAVGTNKDSLSMVDMRISSRNEKNSTNFTYQATEAKNFFTEFVTQISSVQFLRGGQYLASRDYTTVKTWDVRNSKQPVLNVVLQESFKSKYCQVFQNDAILDKFSLRGSKDGRTLLTGSYNNNFNLIDTVDGCNKQYQLSYKKNTICRTMVSGKHPPLSRMNYQNKLLACDFSAKSDILAVASLNTFFIYTA